MSDSKVEEVPKVVVTPEVCAAMCKATGQPTQDCMTKCLQVQPANPCMSCRIDNGMRSSLCSTICDTCPTK